MRSPEPTRSHGASSQRAHRPNWQELPHHNLSPHRELRFSVPVELAEGRVLTLDVLIPLDRQRDVLALQFARMAVESTAGRIIFFLHAPNVSQNDVPPPHGWPPGWAGDLLKQNS